MSTSCCWTCGQSKLSLSLDCIRHTIFINGKGIILLVDKYINNKLIKMKYKGAPLPIATIASRAHGVCCWSAWRVLCTGGAVVVCRGCVGTLLAAVSPCSSGLGGPHCVGVHCGGSCVGVRSCGVLGLWLRWSVGHLGAATHVVGWVCLRWWLLLHWRS
jgi:hypothetical protein